MNTTDKKMTVEVTEKEYREELAKGFTDDEVLKPGKYIVERSPWAEKLKKAKKIKVSIYLDSDIVHYFQIRAGQPNAAPYQTQINNELRSVMENDSPTATSVENDILNNEEFLRALKEKLETVK
jgi:uncharacterized protein (DUF4415 family)